MGRSPKTDLSKNFKRLLQVIGSNISAYRELKGISQAELARKAGLSQTTVHEVESKHFRDIRLSTLLSIATVLETSVIHLLAGSNLDALSSRDQAQLLKASETIHRISQKLDRES